MKSKALGVFRIVMSRPQVESSLLHDMGYDLAMAIASAVAGQESITVPDRTEAQTPDSAVEDVESEIIRRFQFDLMQAHPRRQRAFTF